MEKIDFKNEPDTTTPLDAENLNKLQDNIEKEIKDKQGVKELLGTTAKPINANDIKAIGVYRISGEHTNFFDDRTAAFILYVTWDGEKLIQSVILEEGLYSRSATCTIAGEEISWNFNEWKFRGGRKEVGYVDEELEGTEKILIEDGDFDGVNVVDTINIVTGQEYETGRVIDGKKEYGKRINVGTLPNNTTKEVDIDLTNIVFTKAFEAIAYKSGAAIILPLVSATAISSNVYIAILNNKITITTKADYSSYTNCFVEIFYSKNTD